MQSIEPVMVVDLFPQERKLLLELFSELSEDDWHRPTVCAGWTVRDIGLHLLGDDMGYISGKRDHFINPFFANKDMEQWESLVKNINEANELWVQVTQRISPALLSALLELTGKQFHKYISSLDQMAMNGAVSWAGPDAAIA
ncbi:MAG: maleylpyruvate isomerase N-terminal domain-containing protein [Ktedonobacteraceae bacterium]